MTDIETTAKNASAQYHYPPIHTALLPSPADELQMRLADHHLPGFSWRSALGIIACLGGVFDAEDAVSAVEELGRMLVYAAALASWERMAIAPIIALGREWTRDSGVSSELPLKPASVLAQAVLDPQRAPAAIVRGLAMAIAKALDDCEIVHELKIDPLELFMVAARETLDGKPVTVVTAPAVQPTQPTQPDKTAQRALAWTELRKASEAVVADDAHTNTCDKRTDPAFPCNCKPWDADGGRPVNLDVSAAAVMVGVGVQYEVAEDGMGDEEQIPIPLYAPLVTPDCPDCGTPMSPRADMPWVWACKDHP